MFDTALISFRNSFMAFISCINPPLNEFLKIIMKGFKGFDLRDDDVLMCRNYIFDKDKVNIHQGDIEMCKSGFHFCEELADVFNYYRRGLYYHVTALESIDDTATCKIQISHDMNDSKSVCKYLEINQPCDGEYKSRDKIFYFIRGRLHSLMIKCIRFNIWYDEFGCIHRDDDQPAIVCVNGNKEWYLHGQLHRINGPAVVMANGNKKWYLYGQLQEMVCIR